MQASIEVVRRGAVLGKVHGRIEVRAAVLRGTDGVRRVIPAAARMPFRERHLLELRRRRWPVDGFGVVDVSHLARFADDFTLALFDAGVTRTTIRGIADPRTTVTVQSRDLIRHDITLAEIADAIGAQAATLLSFPAALIAVGLALHPSLASHGGHTAGPHA